MKRDILEEPNLDPRLTFDTFVVGPANRLASAAARRASDSPGTSYNPLFIYSDSGLGKSHILHAVAHHASREELGYRVLYKTLEGYLSDLTSSLEDGQGQGAFREQFDDLDILLLDDVQFLTGQPEAQEMLLRTLDTLSASGRQVVLASDRPPSEIDGLDARLVSRFSGGLLVDMGSPDYETKVAILRKKVEERGAVLADGVGESLARRRVKNIRELGGMLNRILAIQELEERRLSVGEVGELFGAEEEETLSGPDSREIDELVQEIAGVLPKVRSRESPGRALLRTAAEEAESAGYVADRLRRMANGSAEPASPQQVVEAYRGNIARLKQIEQALTDLGNPWSEATGSILRNPDRVQEAEALLGSAQERVRSFPKIPPGPSLEEMDGGGSALAVRAANQFLSANNPEYNPLFLWSREGHPVTELLEATARTVISMHPDATVAVCSIADFANDFIRALSQGVAGAWRERWWMADYLFISGLEGLSETERAQEEFFHLFEAMKRNGGNMLLTADRPPSEISGIDERLRSRFEGGLALQLGTEGEAADASGGTAQEAPTPEPVSPAPASAAPSDAELFGAIDWGVDGEAPDTVQAATPEVAIAESAAPEVESWTPSREKAILDWPHVEDRIVEELS